MCIPSLRIVEFLGDIRSQNSEILGVLRLRIVKFPESMKETKVNIG